MPSSILNFLKPIEIQLSNEAFKFLMSKIQRNDFLFHFFLTKNVDDGARFLPSYDFRVLLILNKWKFTLRRNCNLAKKLPAFD